MEDIVIFGFNYQTISFLVLLFTILIGVFIIILKNSFLDFDAVYTDERKQMFFIQLMMKYRREEKEKEEKKEEEEQLPEELEFYPLITNYSYYRKKGTIPELPQSKEPKWFRIIVSIPFILFPPIYGSVYIYQYFFGRTEYIEEKLNSEITVLKDNTAGRKKKLIYTTVTRQRHFLGSISMILSGIGYIIINNVMNFFQFQIIPSSDILSVISLLIIVFFTMLVFRYIKRLRAKEYKNVNEKGQNFYEDFNRLEYLIIILMSFIVSLMFIGLVNAVFVSDNIFKSILIILGLISIFFGILNGSIQIIAHSKWKSYWSSEFLKLMTYASKENKHSLFVQAKLLNDDIAKRPTFLLVKDFAILTSIVAIVEIVLINLPNFVLINLPNFLS